MAKETTWPDGRLTGTAEFVASTFLNPLREVPVLDLPWKSALDLYWGSDTLIATVEGFVTRVYALTSNTKTLISQNIVAFGSVGTQTLHPVISAVQNPARQSFPMARVRSWGADRLIVTLQNSTPGAPAAPGARVKINYCAYGCEPCAEPDPWTIWPQHSANAAEFTLLAGAGRLHNLWITNFDAVDRWAWLFDTGNQDPGGFAIPGAPGTDVIIPPIYLPPNAKGAAFLDFGRPRGLWPRYGIVLSNATSPTAFVRDLAANLNVTWEVS